MIGGIVFIRQLMSLFVILIGEIVVGGKRIIKKQIIPDLKVILPMFN